MEFDSNGGYNGTMLDVPLHRVLPDKCTMLEADALGRLPARTRGVMEFVIDDLGQRSAKAQGLGAVITTVRKMMYTDQRLYVNRTDRAINGMLKVGRKNLFIRDHATGKMNEINPMCVLDFYVHESVQRGGIGKQLFEEMLSRERMDPSQFGYDRPSPKLIGFLRKHYGLVDFDPQPNNYVVFKAYFNKTNSARGPAQQRQPNAGRRAPYDTSEHAACGVVTADGESAGWQRATPNDTGASSSFFMGGSGRPGIRPDALNRNAQDTLNRTAQACPRQHSDSAPLPSLPPHTRHAEPLPYGEEDSNSISPHFSGGGSTGNWTSKLGTLAANVQHDALAEFATSRQGTGSSQRPPRTWEREPAQRLGDSFGLAPRDKSLQEEASKFVSSHRPASGRRAPFAPLPSGLNPSATGGGMGTRAAQSQWRTAGSEIGGWNQNSNNVVDADAHYMGNASRNVAGTIASFAAQRDYGVSGGGSGGGLPSAALQDRRVGGRLW